MFLNGPWPRPLTLLLSLVTGILSPFSLRSYMSGFPNRSLWEIWKVIIMSSSTLPSYSSSSFRLWFKTCRARPDSGQPLMHSSHIRKLLQ